MKKIYTTLILGFALLFIQSAYGQVDLTTSPYVENFDGIASGLPAGFSVNTGSSATSIGTAVTTITKATWATTSGQFTNYASASLGASATTTEQGNATDRALGVRQTGSFGDAGAAFVFQISNTLGKTSFSLTFDLQSLDANSPRTTAWQVQYGLGSNPTSFTDASTITGTLTTGGSTFSNNTITADFGNALDNQSGVVTIRIVTLNKSTGSGNRPSTAIDNFSLSWIGEDSNVPQLSLTDNDNNTVSSLTFPSIAINQSAGLSYILNGKNLTDAATINVSGSVFSLSTDSVNFSSSLSIAPGDAVNKKIYVKYSPSIQGNYSETIAHISTGATEKDITVTGQAYDPANISFDFNACSSKGAPGSGFTQYSVIGDGQTWACSTYGDASNGVSINGYSGGPVNNEDWLISPKLDLSLYANFPVLSFESRGEYSGPSLTLWASTDYDGVGNPDDFTWTQLNANFPKPSGSGTASFVLSDGINLTAYKSTPVYIAFKYVANTDDGAAQWDIDNVAIANKTQILSVTPSQLYFGEQSAGTHSDGDAIAVQAVGYGDVTVNAPANFGVSLDNSTFSSSIVIPQATAEAGTTIYTDFAPQSKQLLIADSLTFTNGSDLNQKLVAVLGSSYPKSETFDVGCYNLSFFASSGSDAIVRTADEINTQVNNIANVFQHLNIDIAGFEEMSSDSGMNAMISKLNAATGQTYAALISDRWSYYFQPDDPTYPAQKIGIIYNTATMTLSTTEPPRAMFKNLYDSIQNGTATLANYPTSTSSSFWSSGRLPYMATFTANINGVSKKIRFIVLHSKSGADATSYSRRQYDAQVLKDTLDTYYPNDNIIMVGDYNDRVYSSITSGEQSSYEEYITDNADYDALTYPLDEAGETSFPGDDGMIDQILITNELVPDYLENSTQVEPANTYVSPYNKVVSSDHLPVYSRFILQNSAALPVNVTNFNGIIVNNTSKLTWTALTQLNNKRFIIQRSADGKNYTDIGDVKGAGTSSIAINYSFVDKTPLSGVNFYRLMQENLNGTSQEVGVISLKYNSDNVNKLIIYPNPVVNQSRIHIELKNATGNYTARIVSVSGYTVVQTTGTIDDINKAVNSKFNQLASGIYILQVSNGTEKYQGKFIKR
ncbi:hypothetical protein A9P82_02330 [Arachidicoccus ginsenosidimutans]|uniref:T9SS type A sorting domain-containing protein n=1 Tax=Arachidicoccus sp. BS20 TaxID=1850526 RepID=UPI0007F058EF|nr:T9SS type A sorting domain-containing protein [Arachidicoccus sp. BS20]ANI88241.1 hypothetical protein A9P82_02330 [Arachidicoccus sp. BS20]